MHMSCAGIVQVFKIIVSWTYKLHLAGLQSGFLAVDENKATMYDKNNHYEHININNRNNEIIRSYGLVIPLK